MTPVFLLDLPKELEGIDLSSVEWICKQIGLELQQDNKKDLDWGSRLWCKDCSKFRSEVKAGMFSCPKCGGTEYGYADRSPADRTAVVVKKSVHSRSRWMREKLTKVVSSNVCDIILDDFSKVLHVMSKKNLIKGRNLSGYDYYIIRLCSRRGINVGGRHFLKDLKNGKTKDLFDNNLFGIVYRELGWECSGVDKFYTTWLEGRSSTKV